MNVIRIAFNKPLGVSAGRQTGTKGTVEVLFNISAPGWVPQCPSPGPALLMKVQTDYCTCWRREVGSWSRAWENGFLLLCHGGDLHPAHTLCVQERSWHRK